MGIPQDAKKATYEFGLDAYAFNEWMHNEPQDDHSNMHIKNCVAVVLGELTENQRTVIELWLAGNKQVQIAEILCLSRSAISRDLRRGLFYLYDHLRFASPRLLNSEIKFKKVK